MKKKFIVSFLATLLILFAVPVFLYLIASQNPEQVRSDGTNQIVLNKFSSYEELEDFIEGTPQSGYLTFDESKSGALPPAEPRAESARQSIFFADTADSDYSTTTRAHSRNQQSFPKLSFESSQLCGQM